MFEMSEMENCVIKIKMTVEGECSDCKIQEMKEVLLKNLPKYENRFGVKILIVA